MNNMILQKFFNWFTKTKTKWPLVVVGELIEVEPHPNADRLRLTKVHIGNELLNIVCGASNIVPGQRVPVALIGAKLPNGMEIKSAVIRGQASQGMLCAEDELGIGQDHSGIKILPATAKVGDKIDNYL